MIHLTHSLSVKGFGERLKLQLCVASDAPRQIYSYHSFTLANTISKY